MQPHPENNVTAGEMLRRLQEFIFTNPEGEATDNASAVFTRLMTQVIGLVESIDSSPDLIPPPSINKRRIKRLP